MGQRWLDCRWGSTLWKKGLITFVKEGQRRLVFLLVCFLLSLLSFLLLPSFSHYRRLRCPHTFNAGGLLSSGFLGSCSLRAGWRWQVLEECVGAQDAMGHSLGHLDRVALAPPAPMGEWIGDARCCYNDDLISITQEPSPSMPTGCTSAKGKHGLGARAIATPPSWVSALSLRQREEFYWRVSVYQETAVVAT